VWVETIPFRETRNYVQAVLSYNVVLQHMQGNDISLLSTEERQAQY
jgi:soluble lytic murein transglycosylase